MKKLKGYQTENLSRGGEGREEGERERERQREAGRERGWENINGYKMEELSVRVRARACIGANVCAHFNVHVCAQARSYVSVM